MISPVPVINTTSSASLPAATYTTIPISGANVISRSIQNLSASLSRCRPWPEFLALGAIDLPSSLSNATLRLGMNCKYFSVNYAIVTSTCVGASLIASPIALIVVGFVFALWLVLVLCREDPMVIMDRHIDDRALIVCLVLGSAAIIWFTGVLSNLLIGIAAGIVAVAIHGLLRNSEELFLDENDGVSTGLISANQNGGIF